jgi:RimJ/RimL family protein N-acetyltransferase
MTATLQPHLAGTLVVLRPLEPGDWDALYSVAADPLIWEIHPAHDRWKEDVFRAFFRDALDSGGALIALDARTGQVIGSSRFSTARAEPGEIEIGWTFLARSHWGGNYNREMKHLMLAYIFRFFDRAIFLIGEENARSRRAIEKIGAVLIRQTVIMLGTRAVPHMVYAISRPIV